jgi:hypothetical protein
MLKLKKKKRTKPRKKKEELDIWGVDDVNVILSQIYFPRRLFIFSLFIFAVRNFFLVIDELLNLKKIFVSICVEFYLVARLCDPFHRPKYLHLFRKKLFFLNKSSFDFLFFTKKTRHSVDGASERSSIKPERSTSEFHVKKKGNKQHSVVVLVCIKVCGFSRGGD